MTIEETIQQIRDGANKVQFGPESRITLRNMQDIASALSDSSVRTVTFVSSIPHLYDMMSALASGLGPNSPVEQLCLAYNTLSVAVEILFSDLAKTGTSLKRLYLDGNSIEDRSIPVLTSCLPILKLDVIDFTTGNHITHEGAKTLMNGLYGGATMVFFNDFFPMKDTLGCNGITHPLAVLYSNEAMACMRWDVPQATRSFKCINFLQMCLLTKNALGDFSALSDEFFVINEFLGPREIAIIASQVVQELRVRGAPLLVAAAPADGGEEAHFQQPTDVAANKMVLAPYVALELMQHAGTIKYVGEKIVSPLIPTEVKQIAGTFLPAIPTWAIEAAHSEKVWFGAHFVLGSTAAISIDVCSVDAFIFATINTVAHYIKYDSFQKTALFYSEGLQPVEGAGDFVRQCLTPALAGGALATLNGLVTTYMFGGGVAKVAVDAMAGTALHGAACYKKSWEEYHGHADKGFILDNQVFFANSAKMFYYFPL